MTCSLLQLNPEGKLRYRLRARAFLILVSVTTIIAFLQQTSTYFAKSNGFDISSQTIIAASSLATTTAEAAAEAQAAAKTINEQNPRINNTKIADQQQLLPLPHPLVQFPKRNRSIMAVHVGKSGGLSK